VTLLTRQALDTLLRMVVSWPASWVRSEMGQRTASQLRREWRVWDSVLLLELVVRLEVQSKDLSP
jgi:hypothetical protein